MSIILGQNTVHYMILKRPFFLFWFRDLVQIWPSRSQSCRKFSLPLSFMSSRIFFSQPHYFTSSEFSKKKKISKDQKTKYFVLRLFIMADSYIAARLVAVIYSNLQIVRIVTPLCIHLKEEGILMLSFIDNIHEVLKIPELPQRKGMPVASGVWKPLI